MTLLEALSAYTTAILNRRSEDEIQAALTDLAVAITGLTPRLRRPPPPTPPSCHESQAPLPQGRRKGRAEADHQVRSRQDCQLPRPPPRRSTSASKLAGTHL